MTVVSSKEFITHQKRYFDLALNEQVFVKRGKNMFHIMHTNSVDETGEDIVYCEPDDDLRRSITKDELLKGIFEDMEKIFAKK
ncbi:MAG: hypothetical protein LBE36_02850 [Flavobacteriaceae bacterium]|jgi:hypothetical protein|nr:hypothetical protein [Flavobacteriaceae bacterium]